MLRGGLHSNFIGCPQLDSEPSDNYFAPTYARLRDAAENEQELGAETHETWLRHRNVGELENTDGRVCTHGHPGARKCMTAPPFLELPL